MAKCLSSSIAFCGGGDFFVIKLNFVLQSADAQIFQLTKGHFYDWYYLVLENLELFYNLPLLSVCLSRKTRFHQIYWLLAATANWIYLYSMTGWRHYRRHHTHSEIFQGSRLKTCSNSFTAFANPTIKPIIGNPNSETAYCTETGCRNRYPTIRPAAQHIFRPPI